jgi:hypothetical protein
LKLSGESMSGGEIPLGRELAFFEQHKSEGLSQYENKLVVVAGDTITGFYL